MRADSKAKAMSASQYPSRAASGKYVTAPKGEATAQNTAAAKTYTPC